jgi:diguanylate cyclase (GGDEF)-like protein
MSSPGMRAQAYSETGLDADATTPVIGLLKQVLNAHADGPSAPLAVPLKDTLMALVSQIDGLRDEVGLLKTRLSEAQDLADRDGLTPLYNRRALMRELARTAAEAERHGLAASLVYLDLDGFKAVNDRFGHAAGDVVLKTVAERLLGLVRETDVVGRLGGDEFAVILTHADQAAAVLKAADLIVAMEGLPVDTSDWMVPLHLSCGVCEITGGHSPEQILARADGAMYQSKRERMRKLASPSGA